MTVYVGDTIQFPISEAWRVACANSGIPDMVIAQFAGKQGKVWHTNAAGFSVVECNYIWPKSNEVKIVKSIYTKEKKTMLIRSKFSGECKKCKGVVSKGDIVEYSPPEKGVACKNCYSIPDPREDEKPAQAEIDPKALEDIKAWIESAGEKFIELDKRVGKRESRVAELERKILENVPTRVEIVQASGEVKKVGEQHAQFPKLLKIVEQRLHTLLVGPAGSGKTYAAQVAAEALSLPFYAVSVGPQTTQAQLFGYMNATGQYVTTAIRQGYESGGIVLIDEFDAGNPATLTALNALLSGSKCAFPDKMVERHSNFIVIASANTFGNGADRQYVGRNQLDAASLDRLVPLDWGYDLAFERMFTDSQEWFDTVQTFRKRVNELGIRHVVSVRAIIAGDKLLKAGFSPDEVRKLCLERGLSSADRQKIAG